MCENKCVRTVLATITILGLLNTMQFASASSPTDACALLSEAQVATALGAQVDPGKHIIGAGDCRWTERGKPTGADVALLQVNLARPQSYEIGKTPISGWNKPSIAGIGDNAYFADNGRVTFPVSPSLSIKKGSVIVVIIAKVPKSSIEQTKAVEKTVAIAILEKL
jgi:hypothetical protein